MDDLCAAVWATPAHQHKLHDCQELAFFCWSISLFLTTHIEVYRIGGDLSMCFHAAIKPPVALERQSVLIQEQCLLSAQSQWAWEGRKLQLVCNSSVLHGIFFIWVVRVFMRGLTFSDCENICIDRSRLSLHDQA